MEDGLVQDTSKLIDKALFSLNPYCSGRWSRTADQFFDFGTRNLVLILIVVEDGLVLMLDLKKTGELKKVLILIVVEDGLVQVKTFWDGHKWVSVLILIVVEDGLVLFQVS